MTTPTTPASGPTNPEYALLYGGDPDAKEFGWSLREADLSAAGLSPAEIVNIMVGRTALQAEYDELVATAEAGGTGRTHEEAQVEAQRRVAIIDLIGIAMHNSGVIPDFKMVEAWPTDKILGEFALRDPAATAPRRKRTTPTPPPTGTRTGTGTGTTGTTSTGRRKSTTTTGTGGAGKKTGTGTSTGTGAGTGRGKSSGTGKGTSTGTGTSSTPRTGKGKSGGKGTVTSLPTSGKGKGTAPTPATPGTAPTPTKKKKKSSGTKASDCGPSTVNKGKKVIVINVS